MLVQKDHETKTRLADSSTRIQHALDAHPHPDTPPKPSTGTRVRRPGGSLAQLQPPEPPRFHSFVNPKKSRRFLLSPRGRPQLNASSDDETSGHIILPLITLPSHIPSAATALHSSVYRVPPTPPLPLNLPPQPAESSIPESSINSCCPSPTHLPPLPAYRPSFHSLATFSLPPFLPLR